MPVLVSFSEHDLLIILIAALIAVILVGVLWYLPRR